MFKKMCLIILAGIAFSAAPVRAFWKNEITMLVVPREVIPLQIAQDIARRYPVLLVSYQTAPGALRIHAWNGEEWVFVPVEDYVSGTFFSTRPSHAILIQSERIPAPDVLIPDSLWCPTANRLTSTDPRVMIHLLGRYFDFPFRHWNQFAERYGYTLEEINPSLVNVHWWNLRGDEFLRRRANRQFFVDENQWYYQETLQPPAEPLLPEEVKEIEMDLPEEKAIPVIEVQPAGIPEPEPAPQPEPKVTQETPAAAETEVLPQALPQQVPPPAAPAEEPAPPEVAPAEEPMAFVEEDPFVLDEIPAAEIILPEAERKKSWWKIF